MGNRTKNAGFDIIATSCKRLPNDTIDGVALGYRETTFGPEWVTWAFTDYPEDEERFYYWGHYFGTEENAMRDYHERALRLWKE